MSEDKKQKWRENFEAVTAEGGFFEELGDRHKALFVERGKILVVAFENLDDARQKTENRLPWAMDFLTSQGWSALGVMTHGYTWYRDEAVADFFDRLRDEKFFEQFDRVVFYGASMGGYAATAYASCCPGADVIAVSPQATLSRDVTMGWEYRFRPAWKQDYSGRYGFGPDGVKQANKAHIFFDPAIREDAIHASMYRGDNVEIYRCRHMGHGMLGTWRQMGILKEMIVGCVEGTLSRQQIFALLRARRTSPHYQKRMLDFLLRRRRHFWTAQYTRAVVIASRPNARPHFARAMFAAREALKRKQ